VDKTNRTNFIQNQNTVNQEHSARDVFIHSLENAKKKDLAGNRKTKFSLSRVVRRMIWLTMVVSLIAVIVWQSATVISAKREYAQGNDFYQNLADSLSLSAGDTGLISTLYGEKGAGELPDYEEMKNGAGILDKDSLTSAEKKELALYNAKLAVLKSQNSDAVGWIYIPGTNIDYPIVMAPKDDPEFYIDHSFTKAEYAHGALYIEARCRDSILENKNTIIVGHNIRLQGMMFNQLAKFEQEDFFKNHSEVYIYTEEGKFVFNLFSFYRVNYLYPFRRVTFKDDNDFVQYLQTMQENSWHNRDGVTFTAEDRIITMYTCTNDNVKTNRYVAVAVLKDCLLNE